jgi:hypothetical protein
MTDDDTGRAIFSQLAGAIAVALRHLKESRDD